MSNDIPEGHPIHDVWADDARLNLARLSNPDFEGIIEMARNGDKQAIEILIDRFTKSVALGRTPRPEISEWVALALDKIRNGESADIAFGLKPGPGQPRPKRDSKQRGKRATIGAYVCANSSPYDRGSIRRAVEAAAEKFNVSVGTARQAYDAWKIT